MDNKLNTNAIKGLSKIGDIILPKNGDFPSYSEVADTNALSMIIKNAPTEDISSLNLVLSIFAFLPNFILKWVVKKMENSLSDPSTGLIATTFRQLQLGLRGLLFSTYYSEFVRKDYTGKTPLQILDYKLVIDEH